MTTFAAAIAILATFVATLTTALIVLARWHDKPVMVVPDPTPYEDEVPEPDWYAVDPPVTRLYVEPGWTMFRGGLVHVRCLDPYLRHDARPCGECAGHLDQVLTGAK